MNLQSYEMDEVDLRHKEIADWLTSVSVEKSTLYFTLTRSCEINMVGRHFRVHGKIDKLPFKFGRLEELELQNCGLTTFDNFPVACEFLNANDNNITSLVGISDVVKRCETFWLNGNKITEGGLGLLLIEGLQEFIIPRIVKETNIKWLRASKIITKYLKSPNDIFECQNELIEAGYEEYAKL